jgi:threonine synthase
LRSFEDKGDSEKTATDGPEQVAGGDPMTQKLQKSNRTLAAEEPSSGGEASFPEKQEENRLHLLDDASSQAPIIAPELETQKAIAGDISQPLEDRLEAYEDIFDSEVGDTTLSRSRNIEREVGLRQLYLKFEGGNPTGTQKDRIAFAQAMDAMRRGFDAITVATCGNYGAAVALAASMAGLRCIIYIPKGFHSRRMQEMLNFNAEIVHVPGDYESAVMASQERAGNDEIYDANPGGANTALQLKAYGEVAYEIYDDLRDAPAAVAVPVSNGTTLAGIYKGFLSLYRRGKTSRIPRLVAGSSHGKNPIIRAFVKNAPYCEDLKPEQIKETAINEPLINWHSIDGDYALEAVRATGGWASYASDRSMLSYSRLLREREGLSVLPASTAGLIVLLERHRKEPLQGDRYVVILTGRKS